MLLCIAYCVKPTGRCEPSKRAESCNIGASHLNGARFSTPSSLIVDTNAMGRGTMPEIKSL
jgi:hypothetical protein